MPSVKRPLRADGSTDYYEVVQREASVEILPDCKSRSSGTTGCFPGPTIESRAAGARSADAHDWLADDVAGDVS